MNAIKPTSHPLRSPWVLLFLVVILCLNGCRLPQKTIRFGKVPDDLVAAKGNPPLSFFGADIEVVKEGNGFANHDEVELRTLTLEVLRKTYGASPDAPKVATKLMVRSPTLETYVWGTEPILDVEVVVTSTLPNGMVVTTELSRVVDEGTAYASSTFLPSISLVSATALTFTAIGILFIIVPPLGLAILAANAVVMIPGVLLVSGVSLWGSMEMSKKRTAATTMLLVDTLELHARSLAAAMTTRDVPVANEIETDEGQIQARLLDAALPEDARAGRIQVTLVDPTHCVSQNELSVDVNALLPASVAPGLLTLNVDVQMDGDHRLVQVRLFEQDGSSRLVRRMRLGEGECGTLPRFIGRMVRSNVESNSPAQPRPDIDN